MLILQLIIYIYRFFIRVLLVSVIDVHDSYRL